jgi:hypothetical protein
MIVKKSCRAMVEPPEKGERATLNPNLTLCVVINGRQIACTSTALPGIVMRTCSGRAALSKAQP